MLSEDAGIDTIARFGNFDLFKSKFKQEEINDIFHRDGGLLHCAVAGENFDIALFLIENGIDVNMIDADGNTALHYVCQYETYSIEVAKELLKRNIDGQIRDKWGNNAMWTAVMNCAWEHYEMVELLLEYGVDIHTKNKSGWSPLDAAKDLEDEKLIELLTKS